MRVIRPLFQPQVSHAIPRSRAREPCIWGGITHVPVLESSCYLVGIWLVILVSISCWSDLEGMRGEMQVPSSQRVGLDREPLLSQVLLSLGIVWPFVS